MPLPIYSNLIIKADPANLSQVQAQLRRTFSDNNLTIDILNPGKLSEVNRALAETRRQSTGLVRDFQAIGGQVDNVFRRFSAYLIASGGILTTISLFKSAIGEALKFQNELIRIKQVSGDADSVIKELGRTVNDLAKNYGVSSSELAKSATVLKQAGLATKDVQIALKALAKTDLAPNFDSIGKTTEGLIAIFQQFGRNIGDIEGQLGSLNAVAGAFAVEASDLITLVQKAGGAAASSGASFQELLATFTSVRATTRESADAISTGLRTIFGRLQRPDTIKFLDDLGIKMRHTAQEAEKLGNADLAGKFVGPFEAIMRISRGTGGLGQGSTLFSNIVEEIGGLRQLSRVVPLLRETATAVEAYNVAIAGKASLDIQASIKSESYINQLNKIKETFLAIGRTLVESEGFNRFIQFLDTAARASIRLMDALAPLLPYLGAIVGGNIAIGALGGIGKRAVSSFGYNFNTPPPPRKGFASGGIVPGPSNGDNYPAMLEGGEAIIPAKSVRRYPSFIKGLITGSIPGFSSGGIAGDPGWTGKRMGSIDVERALIEVAKRTGINPEEIIKRVKIIKGLESQTHPGFEAAGSMSKSGVMRLNPNQIRDYEHLVNLVAHETGHGRANKLGLLNDPSHKKFLTDPSVMAQAEAFAKSTKQSFAPTGRYGVPYAMTASEMTANLFASGNQGAIRATEQEKARAAEYIAKKEAMMALPPPAPRQPNMLDRFANRVNSGLNSAIYGTWDTIKGMFGAGTSSPSINNQFLAGKLSTNDLSGDLTRTSSSSKRGERYFDALAVRSLDNDNANAQMQAILKAKEQERALKNEIDALREGRREGRQYYPKRLRGDTSGYDFSQVGTNAQDYLRDKGGYIGKIRAKEAELAQLRKGLDNPSFGIRQGSLTSEMSPTQRANIASTAFGGWNDVPANRPYQNVASMSPGPVGAFGFGRNPPEPPMGAFGYGRGGESGGKGGGGGGGSSGGGAGSLGSNILDPEKMSVKSLLSRIGQNRGFNALSTVAGIAAPAYLGYRAGTSTDTSEQNKFGTASFGATIGGSLGSALGPIGTVLGSAIGGIAGWFLGVSVATKELERTTVKNKLDKSIEGLNETIENISTGTGSITDLAQKLDDVRQKSLAKAIADTKDKGGSLIDASSAEFRKNAGLQLPAIQKLVGETIRKQASSGQAFNTEGDLGKLISSIASIRGTSVSRVTEENKKLFDAARLDQINKEAASRFAIEINKSVASATSFADAVGRAAKEASLLDEKLRVLTGGGYVGANFGVGEFGNINSGVLSNLSKLSGGALRGLTGEVGGVEGIAKFLPDVLSRVVKPGQQSSDNLSSDFVSAFRGIAEQTGIQFDKKVINVLADKLQSLKSDDLFEDFRKAPEKFAKELISSYEPALKALQEIGKSLEERDKAYQDGLRQLLVMNDKFNALSEQRVSQSTQYSQIIGGFRLSNAGIDPSRIANVGSVFGPFNREQDRLLGQSGIGGDAASIGALIEQRKAEVNALREKAKNEADSGKATTQFRDALFEAERKLANTNRALERLANTSERLSILQQAIANEENIKSGKLDLTKKILTSSPQELMRLNMQAAGVNFFVRNGAAATRTRFGGEGFSEILGAAEGVFGGQRVKSRFSANGEDLTLKEIAKRLLEEENRKAKGNINITPEERRIAQKQALVEDVLAQAGGGATGGIAGVGGATGIMAANLLKTADDFKKILGDNNAEFFKKIDQYIDELQKNALQSELAIKNTKAAELEPKERVAQELSRIPDIENARKSVSRIRAAKEARSDLDAANKRTSIIAQQAEDFVQANIGKLTPSQMVSALTGKFDISNETAKALSSHFESSQRNNPLIQQGFNESERHVPAWQTIDPADVFARRKTFIESQKMLALHPGSVASVIKASEAIGPQAKLSKNVKGLGSGLLQLSDDALKGLEDSSFRPEAVIVEAEKNRQEILRLQGQINAKGRRVLPAAQATAPDWNPGELARKSIEQEQAGMVRDARGNLVRPPVTPKPRPEPGISPVASFERANEIFTNFNSNFARQVEALAAIPRIIDMNINQKVEVVINGADILNNLEPGMRAIANGAVARAIEVIGGQLRENNISINYNPNETNEQANPSTRGRNT